MYSYFKPPLSDPFTALFKSPVKLLRPRLIIAMPGSMRSTHQRNRDPKYQQDAQGRSSPRSQPHRKTVGKRRRGPGPPGQSEDRAAGALGAGALRQIRSENPVSFKGKLYHGSMMNKGESGPQRGYRGASSYWWSWKGIKISLWMQESLGSHGM